MKLGYCGVQIDQRMYSMLIISKETLKHQEIMNRRKERSSCVGDYNE
jgi:hypothetical protein